jgi:hypothetical protein
MGPRTGLDDVDGRKIMLIPGLERRLLNRPAHSQSLYRLSPVFFLPRCSHTWERATVSEHRADLLSFLIRTVGRTPWTGD